MYTLKQGMLQNFRQNGVLLLKTGRQFKNHHLMQLKKGGFKNPPLLLIRFYHIINA